MKTTWAILLVALSQAVPAAGQQIGTNFTGSNIFDAGFIPPDSMGAVGPNHVVEMLNGRYRVYAKDGTPVTAGESLDDFWIDSGINPINFAFDPRVLYDPGAERFYAAAVDNARGANNLLVAVSNSDDPTAGWTGFQIDADTDNSQWADFPQMGFNESGVFVSANMLPLSGNLTVNLLVLPKSDLLAPVPTVANRTLIEDLDPATTGGPSFQPASDYDSADLSQPMRLFSTQDNFVTVDVLQIDGPVTSPTVNNIADVIASFHADPPLAQQPGPKRNIDTGGDRTRSKVTLIGDAYWGVHGAQDPVSGNANVRWYQIDAATNTLLQEGTISDPDLDLYYPSIAVNEFGNVVIGMTGSSETVFPSAYALVGQTAAGTTTFGDPLLLASGVASYERLDGSGRNRWGDYSATQVDPNDPRSFWTFQEFVSAEDEWSIQITEIRVVPEPGSLATALLLLAATGLLASRFGANARDRFASVVAPE